MYNLIGTVVSGSDRFGKYIAIKADGFGMQIFRDYLDTPKEIMTAYEKYHNITGMVKWVQVVK